MQSGVGKLLSALLGPAAQSGGSNPQYSHQPLAANLRGHDEVSQPAQQLQHEETSKQEPKDQQSRTGLEPTASHHSAEPDQDGGTGPLQHQEFDWETCTAQPYFRHQGDETFFCVSEHIGLVVEENLVKLVLQSCTSVAPCFLHLCHALPALVFCFTGTIPASCMFA